jgi:LDH2 family malate/lactate/ureidoglycolate dehydrogenase
VHETPSTAVVDGDNAIGMIAAARSMEIALEKGSKAGSGWISTRNSNHYGIAGYYAMMALKKDMIGLSMTNANPQVAPTFSVTPMIGTNPIAVAIPAGNQPPFVADFATTPIAGLVWQKKRERRCLTVSFRIKTGIHPMILPY